MRKARLEPYTIRKKFEDMPALLDPQAEEQRQASIRETKEFIAEQDAAARRLQQVLKGC